MRSSIQIGFIVLSLCALGLMISPNAGAAETLVPSSEYPDACGPGKLASQPCHRWYSLAKKTQPDACLDRPGAQACGRWFAVMQEPMAPIVLRDVQFDFDSSQIKPESHRALNKEVTTLKGHKDAKIKIVGYTDSQGDKEYNQRLSEARANAVMEYFIQRGVAPDRMVTKGEGEALPVADNSTETGRAENRRTEMYLR